MRNYFICDHTGHIIPDYRKPDHVSDPGDHPMRYDRNIILVVAVSLIAKKIKGNAGLIAGMAAGSIVKALFMGVVIALVLIPSLLPEAMVPKMAVFQTTFSVTQLITAAIGSVLAFVIWIPLKKVIAEQN